MGEGSISIAIKEVPRLTIGYEPTPLMQVCNNDAEQIKVIKQWCDIYLKTGKAQKASTRRKTPHGERIHSKLIISGWNTVEETLTRIYPYLVGNKKQVAGIALDCIRRYKRFGRPTKQMESNERNRFLEIVAVHDKIIELNCKKHVGRTP